MAAGVLLSVAALAMVGTPILLLATLRLAFAGDARLAFAGVPAGLMTVALAIGCAAALAAPVWQWPARRPETLAIAAFVTAAWPLSGIALPAAGVAIVVVALALVRDRRVPGGERVTGWTLTALLALIATATAISGAALADTDPLRPGATPAVVDGARSDKALADAQARDDASAAKAREEQRSRPQGPDHAKAPATGSPTGEAPNGKPPQDEAPARGEAPATDPPNGKAPHGEGPAHGEAPATDESPATDGPAGTAPALAGTRSAGASRPGAGEAKAYVRAYYTAINEQRFDDAWAVLTPAIRKRFGDFDRWKAGYAKTLSNSPKDIVMTPQGDRMIVRLRLAALEQGCPIARDYDVTWTLEGAAGEWAVTRLSASAGGASSCG
jgi:hypothetical protein